MQFLKQRPDNKGRNVGRKESRNKEKTGRQREGREGGQLCIGCTVARRGWFGPPFEVDRLLKYVNVGKDPLGDRD